MCNFIRLFVILTEVTLITAVACFLCIAVQAGDQAPPRTSGIPDPVPELDSREPITPASTEFRDSFTPRHAPPYPVSKKPGLYTAEDWAAAIDSTWGPGLPYDDKIDIWMTFWNTIDDYFPCFHGLDSSLWDSIWIRYDSEIRDTVSRGRFCAIIQHASMSLMEHHTEAYDSIVRNTELIPGVPLLCIGDYGQSDRFGAGLTPLPDSSLLVYQVASGHPLGLAPGDRVLGYDGVPWRDLLRTLLEAELPMTGMTQGSSTSWPTHRMLAGAGRNWHLFDTIDVVKHATGDTVHLPTSLMLGGTAGTYNSEQLDIPGVPKPDPAEGTRATWGIIDGLKIGYIYVRGWYSPVQTQLYDAVDSLMHDLTTTGIILDFRCPWGGNMYLADPALELLFRDTLRTVRFYARCNDTDRLALCPVGNPDQTTVYPDPNTYYDKPIAVLTGPGARSSGDQNALRMGYHPMARFFGKPTDGSFNGPVGLSIAPEWYFQYALYETDLHSHPGMYLTHHGFPSAVDYPWVPYDEVWLTPDGVAQGVDDVVEAAKAWILSRDFDQDGIVNENDNCPAVDVPGNDPVMTGDVNLDATLTSADIIWLVNYTFKGGSPPLPIPEAGDVNCDGSVTSADVVFMVNHIFKGAAAPCDVCAIP